MDGSAIAGSRPGESLLLWKFPSACLTLTPAAAGWGAQDLGLGAPQSSMSATPVLCQLAYPPVVIAPSYNLASCLGVGF